jgi:hypothetical protein
MGVSTESIPFTDDRMAICVNEGSCEYMPHMQFGYELSLRNFSQGQRVFVEKVIETGEFIFRSEDGTRFACGLPVT